MWEEGSMDSVKGMLGCSQGSTAQWGCLQGTAEYAGGVGCGSLAQQNRRAAQQGAEGMPQKNGQEEMPGAKTEEHKTLSSQQEGNAVGRSASEAGLEGQATVRDEQPSEQRMQFLQQNGDVIRQKVLEVSQEVSGASQTGQISHREAPGARRTGQVSHREAPGAGRTGQASCQDVCQDEQEREQEIRARQQEEQKAWFLQWNKRVMEQREKDEEEKYKGLVAQLQERAEAMKKALDPKNKKNLYDATMDLTLIAQVEKEAALKAIHSRLLFKVRAVKASGAEASEIRAAVNKLKKVLGKVKAKIKCLKKEEEIEKKRKKAVEARRKTKAEALRRELELRKRARKAREQKDIDDSKMGLGANYGGPTGNSEWELAMEAYGGMDAAMMSMDVGAAVDVAVADVGAVAAEAGAVDVGV